MSDRLGVEGCWAVVLGWPGLAPTDEERHLAIRHYPGASAEVGDSGALIIRKPAPRRPSPRVTKPTDHDRDAIGFYPHVTFAPGYWRELAACALDHGNAGDPGPIHQLGNRPDPRDPQI